MTNRSRTCAFDWYQSMTLDEAKVLTVSTNDRNDNAIGEKATKEQCLRTECIQNIHFHQLE